MAAFDYLRPSTLGEALAALAAPGAAALAGGQAILPRALEGLAPVALLVEIGHLAELRDLTRDEEALIVGAAARPIDISDSPQVWTLLPALSDLATAVGNPQMRNKATLGGALAENHPASCWHAAALALEARIFTDRREIAAEEWSQGAFKTPLAPGETIVKARLRLPRRAGWARIRRVGDVFPLASAFVAETRDGDWRIGLAGGREGAFLWREGAAALAGLDDARAIVALIGSEPEAAQMRGDAQADSAHRARLAGRAAGRALARALELKPLI